MGDYRTKDREKVGQILDEFNQLEGLISEIITEYVSPVVSKRYFMYSILLNNSITSFGAKIKVLLRINNLGKYVKLRGHDLHRIIGIRNAVAHKNFDPKHNVTSSSSNDGKYESYLVLEKMGSNGSVEFLDQVKIYEEFKALYEKLWATLKDMQKKVNEGNV